jgi:hypothetical protein
LHVLVRVALEYHEQQIVTLVSEQSKRLDIYGSYSRLTTETMEGAHVSLKSKPLPFRAKGGSSEQGARARFPGAKPNVDITETCSQKKHLEGASVSLKKNPLHCQS